MTHRRHRPSDNLAHVPPTHADYFCEDIMTKKHFIEAARIVTRTPANHRKAVQAAYIELFRAFNSRFDVDRFNDACVVPNAPKQAAQQTQLASWGL